MAKDQECKSDPRKNLRGKDTWEREDSNDKQRKVKKKREEVKEKISCF
jgi:hypothetical protein